MKIWVCLSLFLFNKRVFKFFCKDGHSWRKKKDGRTFEEAHERLKVGNAEALNFYYAHGEQNLNFKRHSYWILDPAYDHIVLVHYRDITEGRHNLAFMSETCLISYAFSPNPSSYSTQHRSSTVIADESYEKYQNQSSPGEICSDAVININRTSDTTGRTEEVISSPGLEMSQALRRLEEQLSFNDDSIKKLIPSMLMQLMTTIHLSRCREIQTVSCCNIIKTRTLQIVHKHVKA